MWHRERSVLIALMCIALLVVVLNVRHHRNTTPPMPDEARPDKDADFRVETMFYDRLRDDTVRCRICFRNCVIEDHQLGYCRSRRNIGGTLYSVVYGRPSAVEIGPVEKEPLHHFLPGTQMLCVGTAGCNFRCLFCHNWRLSQRSIEEVGDTYHLTPEQVVAEALERNAPSISFTFNEPTVFYEYMYDIARLAQEHGVRVGLHSNGSINPRPLRALLKYVDVVAVDLKGFDETFYRNMSNAELEPVLRTLCIIREHGVWMEIVNLVIPEHNDDPETIRKMCRWIKENLGPEVPLHFSRFFPAYVMTQLSPTPVATLEMAYEIAREEGLEFVSVGNVPGHAKNSTYCPVCEAQVIHRHHFTVRSIHLTNGRCPQCQTPIPGVWR